MTCIVGLEQDGIIYMGSDSAITDSPSMALRIMDDPKICVNDDMIIGCSSSLRILQLMHHALDVPDKPQKKSDLEFLVTDFVDAVRTLQKDKGSMKKENEFETHDAHILLGYNGRLYCMEDDFQIYKIPDKWHAVGCGADLALGAMHATANLRLKPEDRVRMALEAAEAYSAGVRRPFHILKQKHEA